MKPLKQDQSGFITMIVVILAILAAIIWLVYTRVVSAGK